MTANCLRFSLVLTGLLAVVSPLGAADPLRPARAAIPPVIDGLLDDAVWRQAPKVTGFKTVTPDFGKPTADDTIAYYAYDAANLYFAFRALEGEPAKIKASMASRDTIQSDDFVCLQLSIEGSASHGAAIYYASQPFAGRSTRASASVVYQPSEQWSETLSIAYASFDRTADGTRVYNYGIFRSRTTFQPNRFLLFRGIVEYNSFRRQLLTDFLASFTYIPGTVVHAGYGSLYERTRWDGERYMPGSSLAESRRGFFFKASYLWRL
jgi:hypothetical protein